MKDLLQVIIEGLVDKKNEVSISEKVNDKIICLTVKVAPDDMGKIIGKQGRMAKSIRNVMKSVAANEHKKVNIEFVG